MVEGQFCRTITVMPVVDIAAACAWYREALGLETHYLHEGESPGEITNYAVLARDGVQVHLILDEPPPHAQAWTQAGTGYLYLRVRDVQAVYEAVVARGMEPTRGIATEGWGARAFLLTDPSGNSVRVEEQPMQRSSPDECQHGRKH